MPGSMEAAPRDPRVDRRLRVRFALGFFVIAVPMFALYTFPYNENGIAENWFDSYLSGYAHLAGAALALVDPGVTVSGQDIIGRYSLRIIKSCDAMEAVILLAAAVLAFPVSIRKRAVGVVLGTVAVVATNVLRICCLYYVGIYRPKQFEFFHLEVFPLVLISVAVVVFYVWIHWASREFPQVT